MEREAIDEVAAKEKGGEGGESGRVGTEEGAREDDLDCACPQLKAIFVDFEADAQKVKTHDAISMMAMPTNRGPVHVMRPGKRVSQS